MIGGVCLMYAFNQRVEADGRRRIDLMDRFGTVIRRAYVMSGVGLPINVPLEADTPIASYTSYPQVVVGFMPSDPVPVVLGALDNMNVSYVAGKNTDTHYVDDGMGYRYMGEEADENINIANVYAEECVLASPRGGRVILKHNGHAAIAGQCISLQVPEGSFIRLAAGGEATGRVPLVMPLVNVFDEFTDRINALQEEVKALRKELSAGATDNGTTLALKGYIPTLVVDGAGKSHTVLAVNMVAPETSTDLIVTLPAVGTSDTEDMASVDPMALAASTIRVTDITESTARSVGENQLAVLAAALGEAGTQEA
jgi:hypothetical protein